MRANSHVLQAGRTTGVMGCKLQIGGQSSHISPLPHRPALVHIPAATSRTASAAEPLGPRERGGMAQRLAGLVSKAKAATEPAWKVARTETVKQYESLMSKNSQYVVKDSAAADKLLKQYVFTQLSR